MATQENSLHPLVTKRQAGKIDTIELYCKQEPEVGFKTNNYGTPEHPIFYAITEVLESKKPSEFGARPLNQDMAPAEPSFQPTLELSYAGVDGVDKPIKGKHFLTAEEHRQRREYCAGDPKKDRNHGWYWARVRVQKVV